VAARIVKKLIPDILGMWYGGGCHFLFFEIDVVSMKWVNFLKLMQCDFRVYETIQAFLFLAFSL